jgi:hypothetical protein
MRIVRTGPKQLPFALGKRLNVEVVLGAVFIPSSAVAVIFVLSGKYPTAFWVSSVIALGTLTLSKQRLAWVGGAVAYLSVPLALEALGTGRRDAIAGVIVAGILFGGAIWHRSRREWRELAALVEGRRCPTCGGSIQKSQLARAVRDGNEDGSMGVINRCACGEWTLFDETGASHHVVPHHRRNRGPG